MARCVKTKPLTLKQKRDLTRALDSFAYVFRFMHAQRDALFRQAAPHTGTKHGNIIIRLAQLLPTGEDAMKDQFCKLSVEISNLCNL